MSTRTPPTWLITGTSSGLGLSLSKLILQKGHNLISVSRHPEPDRSLIDLARSYKSTGTTTSIPTTTATANPSGLLHHIPLDLSNPSPTHLKSTITDFLTTNPTLHPTILVNNAAVTTFSPLEQLSSDHLQHIMTTNFFSPLYLIQAVLPYMRGAGAGQSQSTSSTPPPPPSTDVQEPNHEKVIVNISSTQGLCTDPSETSYDASKHALEAISGVLAAEVGTFGIRVMIVNLGSLRTGFARGGERSGIARQQGQGQSQSQSESQQGQQNTNTEPGANTDDTEGTNASDPYADPNHPVRRRMTAVNKLVDVPNLARGDPNKTASILFDGVMRTKGTVVDEVLESQRQRTLDEAKGSGIGRVERLVLGSDAQPKIERVLERLRGDVEGCRGVSGLVEADG